MSAGAVFSPVAVKVWSVMKRPAILLSSALLLGMVGSAFAQTDDSAPASAPAPINLTGVQNATFGNPRSSNDGSQTRVVFDLMPGVTYTLTPTFTGLRLDVQGARVIAAVVPRFGNSIIEYRAAAGQVTLVTPFPLGVTDGWQASEATLANGNRVLIVEISPTLSGGASDSLRAQVRTVAQPLPLPAPGTTAATSAPAPTPASTAASAQTPIVIPPAKDSLPPGDSVAASKTLPPAPALPGTDSAVPSNLTGRVPGTPMGITLAPPRIGKNPGQTRVVLDLPPGAGYRIVPGGVGLRVDLTGVNIVPQVAQNVSPEVRSWRYDASKNGNGGSVTFVTGTPTGNRSGWRAQLLPPGTGSDRARLAIDLSPALADLTPIPEDQRLIAAVPPVLATRGTAILALSANYVRPRVIIDPGHGGKDPGAVGAVVEKDVTLDVALRVRELLNAAGVDVVMTREGDWELNPSKNTDLEMRAGMGTPGTMMFVSIHVNARDARHALEGYGIETWWNPNHPLSSSLAGILQAHMIDMTGASNQGLHNTRSLSVLRNSRIPAALVEIGFTSHPVDGLNLKDNNYLDRVAVGIAQGIREALMTGITANGAVGGAGK